MYMSNEVILLLSALVDLCFVLVAARLGQKWLLASIAVNLILVSMFGAQLISVMGFVTNIGNVFYASVFFATHLLLERVPPKKALNSIRFGAAFVLFFLVMSWLAVNMTSYAGNETFKTAFDSFSIFSPRVVFASLLAYLFAQHVNTIVYSWAKSRTKGKLLWLRSSAGHMVGQGVDSCIFFTIAFLDMPGLVLVQAIVVGWLLKVCVGLLGVPLLYLDAAMGSKK